MPRPKAFDPDHTLHKAMQIFWERGYEATTMQDLVDGMGINRFSLYSTFGDKHQLFLTALEHYRHTIVKRLLRDFERPEVGIATIRQFFTRLLEAFTSAQGCRGCFVTNTAVECATHDAQAAAQVQLHITQLETAFGRALQQAQQRGEVVTTHAYHDLARFLAGSALALGVLAKTVPGRQALEGYVAVVLSVLR